MEEKKKTIIYVVISIGLLLSAVVGATFAYFRAQVGDGANVDINATTDTVDSLMFENEGELTITANQTNFNNLETDSENNGSIKDDATVKATLKANSTTKNVTKNYNIFLIIDYNDFEYTKDDEPELLLKLTGPDEETVYKTFTGLTYKDNITDRKGTTYEGYDITGKTHKVYKIVNNYSITANEEEKVDTWKVELVFVNYNRDQNKNTGKSLRGRIYITAEDSVELPEISNVTTTKTTESNTITITPEVTAPNMNNLQYYYKIDKVSNGTSGISAMSLHQFGVYEPGSESETFSGLDVGASYKISCVVKDEKDYISNVYETAIITMNDKEMPTVGNVITTKTTETIKVDVTANNATNYSYKIGDGEWSDWTSETSHTFTGLKPNTEYKISVKVKNSEEVESNERIITSTTEAKITLTDVCKDNDKTLAECIIELNNEEDKDKTDLYYHNGEIKSEGETVLDANDKGYRYSGNNPNNFICFGAGSEKYNDGSESSCPLTNQYRIIGLVPVTKADGTKENLVKVIKSEYITKEELGKTANDGTVPSNSSYTTKKRVEADVTKLDGFYWNLNSNKWTDGKYNYWSKDNGEETPKVATLNESLNDDKAGYLSKLKKEDDGIDWTEKIEEVQWNVGGVNTNSVTPKAMKEAEESSESEVTAQIGLMYIYDYGFASAKENWGSTVGSGYNTDTNRSNNWLFNGVSEWTISRHSSNVIDAFDVYGHGGVTYGDVRYNSEGVRPVFYLKSNVEIKSDGADGSSEHPFRVQ